MAERYLTAQEVADLLKIKKNTVYDMIKKGSLRAVKVGKQFRVAENEVRAVLGQAAPAAPAYQPPAGGERFIVCGQDALLDLLCDSANQALGEPFFFRSYMGSYNGLHAMYQGQADAATAHLWDMETDTYNLPFVGKLLPGERVAVYHLVGRTVGIYTAAGNPKGITSIEDFARPDVTTVSREKGSGIRVLTDSLFARAGIAPRTVHGYETVVGSHLAAAAAVAGGQADCAVGNQKAALQTPAVEFVPLRVERYDLVLRQDDLERPQVRTLLTVLRSPEFRAALDALGGYDTAELGKRLQ